MAGNNGCKTGHEKRHTLCPFSNDDVKRLYGLITNGSWIKVQKWAVGALVLVLGGLATLTMTDSRAIARLEARQDSMMRHLIAIEEHVLHKEQSREDHNP